MKTYLFIFRVGMNEEVSGKLISKTDDGAEFYNNNNSVSYYVDKGDGSEPIYIGRIVDIRFVIETDENGKVSNFFSPNE